LIEEKVSTILGGAFREVHFFKRRFAARIHVLKVPGVEELGENSSHFPCEGGHSKFRRLGFSGFQNQKYNPHFINLAGY